MDFTQICGAWNVLITREYHVSSAGQAVIGVNDITVDLQRHLTAYLKCNLTNQNQFVK